MLACAVSPSWQSLSSLLRCRASSSVEAGQRRPPACSKSSPAGQAGTACPTFPADNYWHADVRSLPVAPAQRRLALAHVDATSTCTPTSGRRTATGPNYGIPVTVVDRHAPQGPGPLRLRRRERQGALPARPGHPDRGRPRLRTATGTRSWSTGPPAGSTRPGDPGLATAAGAPARAPPGRCAATSCAPTAGPPPTRPGCRSCPGCCAGTRCATATVDHAIRFTTDVTSTPPPVAGAP